MSSLLVEAELFGAMDTPPADERRDDADFADPVLLNSRDVVGEQHEVGELAGGEAAALVFLSGDPGGVEGAATAESARPPFDCQGALVCMVRDGFPL
jgi:hypothetical protein